jgi:hypothetical protein
VVEGGLSGWWCCRIQMEEEQFGWLYCHSYLLVGTVVEVELFGSWCCHIQMEVGLFG